MRISLILALSLLLPLQAQAESLVEQLAGTVRINDCSGSIVTLEGRLSSQKALVLTNGHCVKMGSLMGQYPAAGEAFFRVPQKKHAVLFSGDPSSQRKELVTEQLLYATMTDTDIGLYALAESYDELKKRAGVVPFVIAKYPRIDRDTRVRLPSGYWMKNQTCVLESTVHKLKEGDWTWGPSLRLSTGCNIQHGASGSPILEDGTNIVIGVVNTVYFGGEACSFDNPCEVDDANRISVGSMNQPYGQLVNQIYSCLDSKNELDLNIAGCPLTKVKN